ncbi:MAG: DUF373 family protein [Halobacteriota archaeon]
MIDLMDTRTLVLCVDRDNDIGEKAGLKTPIVGRDASISAATKLALADPEDSDVNAIFEAVRIYDKLSASEEGGVVEIALVTGDKDVGVESDRKIGKELDMVLTSSRADSAIIVTDGAEDERIIPLIQSRIKIDSVSRVVVKQSEPLESTFYVIKKLFEDPKFSRTFLPPLGLVLFLLAISFLFDISDKGVGLILAFTGLYILLKGIGHENILMDCAEAMRQSLYSGRISFVTYIGAIVLFIAGTFQGITGSYYYIHRSQVIESSILWGIVFIEYAIWWYVGAALAPLIGKMMQLLLEGGKIVGHWAILFSIIGSGLILWGGSKSIILLSEGNYPMGYQVLFFSLLGAVVMSLIGMKLSWYMRKTVLNKKKNEPGIETE